MSVARIVFISRSLNSVPVPQEVVSDGPRYAEADFFNTWRGGGGAAGIADWGGGSTPLVGETAEGTPGSDSVRARDCMPDEKRVSCGK